MTHGEVLALVGGGALMVGGGVALWMLRRQASASSSSVTTVPSSTVSQTLPATAQAQAEALVKASGISLFYLAHAPVGSCFNGRQYVAAQRAAAALWDAGIRSIPGYTGANVVGTACSSAPGTAPACRARYTVPVYTGQNALEATLGGIALKFGTTVAALIQANQATYPSISSNYVQAGWVLCIPA